MNRTYVGGRVWVRRSKCETCIFRPGNLMHLEPGRVDEMVGQASEGMGSSIPCHHHLHQDSPIEPVCRGFFDLGTSTVLQIADRMGTVRFTNNPAKEYENVEVSERAAAEGRIPRPRRAAPHVRRRPAERASPPARPAPGRPDCRLAGPSGCP